MVREGLVWDNVQIVTDGRGDPSVKCRLCDFSGSAGATRLSQHFLCQPGNIRACRPQTAELKEKLTELYPEPAMIEWHKEISTEDDEQT